MELKYVKAMQQFGIAEKNLPQDAKIGVKQIKSILKKIEKAENSGKNVGKPTLNKVNAMDKWVYYEILDMVNETDKNEDEMPYSEEDFENEFQEEMVGQEDDDEEDEEDFEEDEEEDESEPEEDDEEEEVDDDDNYAEGDKSIGERIEVDFNEMYKNGKTKISLEQLKSLSKSAYDVIFGGYDEDGDNGIETTNFSLIETSEYEFTLTKK